ncbi:MAG: ribosome rescue GTPase HflX [Pseudomonadota bacterium]
MFERPSGGERTLLVHVGFGRSAAADEREEFALLAESAGADVVAEVSATLATARPRYLVGRGKLDEIAALKQAHDVELLLVSKPLSPSQERNLERELKCRVLDRNGLILDIFAQRARSFEGKLQVELAQLKHMSTRLVRGWTHLERQKGGIGLRGPGESQLETDRRLIGQRITHLNKRLVRVDGQRELGRRRRTRQNVPVVALVGYTNAGKSTLFNALTKAEAYAADQLFATLDPTLRRLPLGDGTVVVLADTVGFVRDLPHELVAAFRSTLAETREASLILHVVDASDPHRRARRDDVDQVLKDLEADHIPTITVYNKVDLLTGTQGGESVELSDTGAVRVSARTGEGLDRLTAALVEQLGEQRIAGVLQLPPSAGRLRAKLFQMGAVSAETTATDGSWRLTLDMPKVRYERFCRQENLPVDALETARLN